MRSEIDRQPPSEMILRVLGREDPEGLLALGAPTDEYVHEANDLAQWLRGGRPLTGEVLIDVWERWFGPGSGFVRRTPRPQIDDLAAELDAFR